MSKLKRAGATHAEIRDWAVNEYARKHPKAFLNLEGHVKGLMTEFAKAKLHDFPNLCVETRRVNYLKQEELEALGNPKGWSPSKDFKFDYVIPKDLYMFMVNMVYRNFWDEENEKVWRSFMKAIMRGDEAMRLLGKVRLHYGSVSKIAQ